VLFERCYFGDYFDDYEEDNSEEEYAEYLDKCEQKYAEDYSDEHAFEFEEYLEYSGYSKKEFLGWTKEEQHGAYVDFLHEAEDREEYIREREGLL
jgi:hypothetical protein